MDVIGISGTPRKDGNSEILLRYAFKENMVLNIEVWESFKTFGIVRIEDCYRITKSGCERLSSPLTS